MNVVRTDKFLILGDSIADPAFTFQIFLPMTAQIVGHYAGTGAVFGDVLANPAGGVRPPTFVNCAVTSQTTNEILAGLAANLALNPGSYTGVIIGTFINDAALINAGSMTLADLQNNLTAIYSACASAGITKALAVGPLCDGEKYPTGQNGAIDTAIDNVNSTLTTFIPTLASGGIATSEYVDLRTTVYAVQEPIYNTLANGYANPPGLADGPLCIPVIAPGVIPGLHPNAFGRSFCTTEIMKKVTFT